MTTATAPTTSATRALRRLYLVRFGFAVVWAVLLFLTASTIGPLSAALLVLYPVFDVAAAVVDARSSRTSTRALTVNIAISSLAAIALIVVVTSGVTAVLGVWGAWAIVAGLVQLVVALGWWGLGGQWAMIASGSISVLAGASFLVMASGPAASLTALAGYALLGGIFFLVSGLRISTS
ncbi:hypothetical protein LQ327_17640 [Actinomycetospora endophytica]|uniref:Integral membrane protein n=1 Tax=Actinomycetospora endophytica TaxID=2291215 RepID=A0ABS8PAY4_9PSEU|nr:hypothetical protein [Actinomycetospora endophytica]MCD2195193.1 hypothetical protein [Actinomycetospora endophytica]